MPLDKYLSADSKPCLIGNVTTGKNPLGLIKYVLGKGEKARIVGGNMLGRNPQELAKEFQQSLQRAPHLKNPIKHFSLSLPPGAHLSHERWREVFDDFLGLVGLDPTKRQYLAVLHFDKEHEHGHLITTSIGTDGIIHDHWLALKTMSACARLAQKYRLASLSTDPRLKNQQPYTNSLL